MQRENGYYWVKINVGWRIAEWQHDCWYLVGGFNTFIDADMLGINEDRITAPDELTDKKGEIESITFHHPKLGSQTIYPNDKIKPTHNN
jgi:hypothetical protein